VLDERNNSLMWKRMLSGVWRRLPKQARRAGVLVTQSRFTVTVGAVILDSQNRVLLLEHRFRPGNGWGVPGGFINPQEQPEDAVRRELREEVGLELEQLEIAFINTLLQYQQIEIIFRAIACNNAQPNSLEIRRAEWFDPAALPSELSQYQRSLVERATKIL
jgi:8-oxo-dGTP diphosphatase